MVFAKLYKGIAGEEWKSELGSQGFWSVYGALSSMSLHNRMKGRIFLINSCDKEVKQTTQLVLQSFYCFINFIEIEINQFPLCFKQSQFVFIDTGEAHLCSRIDLFSVRKGCTSEIFLILPCMLKNLWCGIS